MRRVIAGIFSPLGKPVPAWVMLPWTAGLLVCIGLAIPSVVPVQTVREVRVVEKVAGSDRVITRYVKVCDGESVLKALNEVERSKARTGGAGVGNDASGGVGLLSTPHESGPSHASADGDNAAAGRVGQGEVGRTPLSSDPAHADAEGDNAAAVAQTGVASSGDAVLGQVLSQYALCGNATMTATNTVTDSKAVTGDAEVNNDADTVVGQVEAAATPSASPAPGLGDRALGDTAPSPSPSPSPSPVVTLEAEQEEAT